MRGRTLAEIRHDVRVTADIVNQLNRHSDEQLRRWINESIQRFRAKVSSLCDYYLAPLSGNVAAGNGRVLHTVHPSTGSGIAHVSHIDVLYNGRYQTVYPLSTSERNDWGGPGAAATQSARGVPQYYTISGGSAPSITVYPTPDAAYSLVLWVVPTLTDLANNDVFDGVQGCEDWVRWDVSAKVGVRDKNVELYQMASTERESVWREIQTVIRQQSDRGPGRRVDTRGRRRGNMKLPRSTS
jgi:hypothetical protein